MDRNTLKFYCISLVSRLDRRERMSRRWAHHRLRERLEFVDAVTAACSLIDYYGEGIWHDRYPIFQQRCEVGCFASHLKALRKFLEDSDESVRGCIVVEDDALLRNDWTQKYQSMMESLPDDATLVCLGYFVEHWVGFKWSGKNKDRENLCQIVPEHVWGTVMYWISRKYAIQVLEKYDRPFRALLGQHITAELITRFSGGYISYPPLSIEDCISSDIRSDNLMPHHVKMMKPWGYSNYSDTEYRHESPLYKDECNTTGKPFDPLRQLEQEKRALEMATVLSSQLSVSIGPGTGPGGALEQLLNYKELPNLAETEENFVIGGQVIDGQGSPLSSEASRVEEHIDVVEGQGSPVSPGAPRVTEID